MEKQPWLFDDEPAASDGPDYVALVIEWDNIADELDDQITSPQEAPMTAMPSHARSRLPLLVGGLGVLAAMAWGIHKLRA